MPDADLVLEGGGVKGSGLVGAITALVDRDDPYVFHRIAGTSAGAIVASMLAAGLDFSQFEDEPKAFKHAPHIGAALGLLFKEGLFIGDFMHRWISEILASHGIRTWADLRIVYPIDIFDRHDDKPSRWPTLGVKLSARTTVGSARWSPDADNFQLARSLLSTMQGAHDRVYISDPSFASRTIFVDTTGFNATDFGLTAADKTELFTNGEHSAQRFLGVMGLGKVEEG